MHCKIILFKRMSKKKSTFNFNSTNLNNYTVNDKPFTIIDSQLSFNNESHYYRRNDIKNKTYNFKKN